MELNFREYVDRDDLTPEEELELINDKLMRFSRVRKFVKGLDLEIFDMVQRKRKLESVLRLMNQRPSRNAI